MLRQTLESLGAAPFDGEIIYPFFQEGGRYTLNNIHYVREGDQLIPAGMTEFARDRSFGYTASSLPQWCQEKCQGGCRAEDVTCIALEDLRAMNLEKITRQLLEVGGFGKVIVNSADYADVKVFTVCFLRALRQGKRFLFRSAAAVTKVLGGIADRPLLTRAELVPRENCNGGIVLIGSHVNKTTQQMEELRRCRYPLEFLEFNQHLVLQPGGLEGEVIQCIPLTEIAYASNSRNEDTVSIEVCHPDADGAFSQVTYDRVVELTAWLCESFQLDPGADVIRHYDVTGKECPLYYVDHPDAWEQLKSDVAAAVKQDG